MLSTSPINVIQTLNKPVKTLEDIKGLKLRGTGRLGDIVKALGGHADSYCDTRPLRLTEEGCD